MSGVETQRPRLGLVEGDVRQLRSLGSSVLVQDIDEPAGQAVRILYGGSLKPENAEELLGLPDVDGALVGGASLDPESFAHIVELACGVVPR